MNGTRLGEDLLLPFSSSFTFTSAAPAVLSQDSSALTWMNNWPLSSVTPRAYTLPSLDHRLERRRIPTVLHHGRHHVVVAVDQHGRFVRPALNHSP